jgi:hypothetical protein
LKEPASPTNHAGLIWAIADLLRGDYKQSEYGRVILPLVLLRRLDCVLVLSKVTEVGLYPDKVTEDGRRTDELACGRKDGRLPVNGLPARQRRSYAGT